MLVRFLKALGRVVTAPLRWLIKVPIRMFLMVLLLLVVLAVLVPNVIEVAGQRHNIYTVEELANGIGTTDENTSARTIPGDRMPSGTYDAIVVLGAAVRPDGTPSPILEDRIRKGVELYFAGVAPKIIMSGDNTSDRETYNEVVNMKRFAMEELGVPSEDIFCDHAGLNTYDSMYRAYHVFGVQRMVVVTQTYHLYRALFDANSFPVEAVGVASDLRGYAAQLYYDAREVAARVSDYIKVRTESNATILSEPVSLDQSGDVTTW